MSHETHFNQSDTHRLIPTKYSSSGTVLDRLNLSAEVLSDLSELDAATNDRKVAELGGLVGIRPIELVYGVPDAHIINAAFTHPHPSGSRFNDGSRGAWYAAKETATSLQEIAYHMHIFQWNAGITGPQPHAYQDFLADFVGSFQILDPAVDARFLQPEPVPARYAPGQVHAASLLNTQLAGIVYPSVRHPGGTCIACLRPPQVINVRRGPVWDLVIDANAGLVSASARP